MASEVGPGLIVHIVAPFAHDASTIAEVLLSQGMQGVVHDNLDAVASALDEPDQVGAVLLTDEAVPVECSSLASALARQPTWSDIPFVLLRASRGSRRGPPAQLPAAALNIIELERPLGAASISSAVLVALRGRKKQFFIRDQMVSLATSRKALAQSERELRLIADALPTLIAFVDTDLVYRFVNRAYQTWFGPPPEHYLGQRIDAIAAPQHWPVDLAAIAGALEGESTRVEVSWQHGDGSRRDAEVRYLPRLNAGSKIDGLHIFAADITASKVALEGSRQQANLLEQLVVERTASLQAEMLTRQKTEESLRQAQKMEAVGQLTGGIAHDFNNMLTGITMSLDMIRVQAAQGNTDRIERFVEIASTSAQRAAALTQRLLAFSRRQSLDSRPVDVNKLIEGMHALLSGTLGESIRLGLALAPDAPSAMADLNQLENALLNLAINARDAMPHGGSLEISSQVLWFDGAAVPGKISAGHYVVISVRDTGTGMSKDVLEKIFEPFFTTKPIGQGTGLGMSMIYGFVQQSHGHLEVESKPGMGTCVSIFLPLAVAAEQPEPVSERKMALGQGQRILVVEDDHQVRTLVTEYLASHGYQVDSAPAPREVLDRPGTFEALHLLVTDVGLPGMNGRQLAEIARQSHPGLPILFMTGYAENAQNRGDFLEQGMQMIAKPFALEQFGALVEQALGNGQPHL